MHASKRIQNTNVAKVFADTSMEIKNIFARLKACLKLTDYNNGLHSTSVTVGNSIEDFSGQLVSDVHPLSKSVGLIFSAKRCQID